jgi:hypothetical protein
VGAARPSTTPRDHIAELDAAEGLQDIQVTGGAPGGLAAGRRIHICRDRCRRLAAPVGSIPQVTTRKYRQRELRGALTGRVSEVTDVAGIPFQLDVVAA